MAYSLIYDLMNVERTKVPGNQTSMDGPASLVSSEGMEESSRTRFREKIEALNPAVVAPVALVIFFMISYCLVAGSVPNNTIGSVEAFSTGLFLPRNGDNAIQFGTGQVLSIWLIFDDAPFGADLALDGAGNFCTGCSVSSLVKDPSLHAVTDLGIVTNLDAVDEVPASGWDTTSPCSVGHAYVVSTYGGLYFKLLVEDAMVSTTGDVVGYILVWSPLQ